MANSVKRSFLFFISLGILFSLLFVSKVFGAGEPLSISEVAWMGNSTSADDEFLEIHNAGESAIDLSGFLLEAEDGMPKILITASSCVNTIIPAHGYFLLERSNDNSVPGISADCIYFGSLENGGEVLSILDAASTTVFTLPLTASSTWPGGNNTSKLTMQWDGSAWVSATATPRAALASSAVISGAVFNDENGNKMREENEGGMEGWRVRLFQYPHAPWKDGIEGMPAREVVTDNAGIFSFENVPAGMYQVFMEERAGWQTQTKNRYTFLPMTLSANDRAELALTFDATAQMMLGCALKTTTCSKDFHQKLLKYRYFGVQVSEGNEVGNILFANKAL